MSHQADHAWAVLLTGEHAGNRVPKKHVHLFRGADELLASHRGWDIGTMELGEHLREALSAPFLHTRITRLLVDANRSFGHRDQFSELTRGLDDWDKDQILDEYYFPYRDEVEEKIQELLARHPGVLHLSLHSFTPVLKGKTRDADVGILYDPSRRPEVALADRIKAELEGRSRLKVRRNYPYLGTSDGFTSFLRKELPPSRYAGIELEVNQRFPTGSPKTWQDLQRALAAALTEAIAGWVPAEEAVAVGA